MGYNPTYKWDKSRVNPLITGVVTHLLSGMNHQVFVVFQTDKKGMIGLDDEHVFGMG